MTTADRIQVLTANGYRVPAIAAILNISAETVYEFLDHDRTTPPNPPSEGLPAASGKSAGDVLTLGDDDDESSADWQPPSAQSGSGVILPWATGTEYVTGQPVTNSGHTYTAVDDHTAGATFGGDSAHWTLLPVAKADVGLSNVDNTSDANKPVSTAQATADGLKLAKASNLSDVADAATSRTNLGLGSIATVALDTDGTLAANSDTRGPSQKAVKTYVGTRGAILAWATATAYAAGQPVTFGGQTYTANDAHTSGATFAGDLAAHWTALPITSSAAARTVAQAYFGGAVLGTRGQQIGMFGTQDSGTNTGYNTRTRHPLGTATTFVRLVYINQKNAAGQPVPTGQILVSAGLESPGGTVRPVRFAGQLTATVDPGGVLVSDPVSVNVAALGVVFVRTYSRTAGGSTTSGAWPMSVYTSSALGEGVVLTANTVAPTDLSKSGTITASDSFGYGPFAIVGAQAAPGAPTLGAWGDSIVSGTGDADYYIAGFIARALNENYGWLNLGLGGDTMSNALALAFATDLRPALIPLFSNVVITYGTNDVAGVATLAQIQANFIAGWRLTNGCGARVFQTTIVPRTTTSDSFATTANQSTVSTNSLETKRQAFNAWLRAGAPVDTSLAAVAIGTPGALLCGNPGHPLYAVWDTAATVESTSGGTPGAGGAVWQVGKTDDGIHPGYIGAGLMAAACNLTQLAT